MRINSRRVFLWVLIAGLVIFNAREFRTWASAIEIPMYDYIEYWSAARLFLDGANPYSDTQMLQYQRASGWSDPRPVMMWNPPGTLLLAAPFSLLPYWKSRFAWFLIHLLAIFIAADYLWRSFGGAASRRWIAALTAFLFVPDLMAVYLGQITPFILAGVAGFLWAIEEKKPVLAGFVTFLLALKPQVLYAFWIILILWILKQRQWRVAAGAGASLFIANLIVFAKNPSIFGQYFSALRSDIGPLIWATPTWGTALRLLMPHQNSWLLQLSPCLLGCGITAWLWRRWKGTFSWSDRIVPILLLSIITSSFTWMFDWVLLLPAAIAIMVWFQGQPLRRWHLPVWLFAFQAAAMLQPPLIVKGFSWIWMPVALAMLYCFGVGEPLDSDDSQLGTPLK